MKLHLTFATEILLPGINADIFFFFLQNFAPQQECIPNSPCGKTIDIIQMISRFNCNCFEREREMIHHQETSSL
jgi:hypothetical protein